MAMSDGLCIFVMKGMPDFSSHNPDIQSADELDFFLSNGQRDVFPRRWTYPIEQIEAAMLSFIKNGDLPSEIEWEDNEKIQ